MCDFWNFDGFEWVFCGFLVVLMSFSRFSGVCFVFVKYR